MAPARVITRTGMDRIGRYKIVRELGRGAMGVVYHAIDPNIGRSVAIKTIHLGGDAGESGRLRERLFREARSAGILSHPGIVTIYDVEQQGDLAYIAMEFVDGPTLDQVMAPSHVMPPEQIFSVLAQAAAALDYAHQKGIVHRDIKPANIMMAADGTVKIADFGIAKITASDQFTMTGSIVGTPHYMSPEQVQGQPVDGRSDQFSLAVIAFELLTGEKPHTGEQLTTVVYKIVAEEPISPRRLNATLTAAIEAVLRKALAKKPDGRYNTCQEMVSALEQACAASPGMETHGARRRHRTSQRPWSPPRRRPACLRPATLAADDTTVASERPAKSKSGFWTFLGAVLVVAVVLALIGWQADPNLPQKVGGFAQRVQVALGLTPRPAPIQPARKPVRPGGRAKPVACRAREAKPSPMPPAAPAETPKTEAAQPAPSSDADAAATPAEKSAAPAPEISRPPARPPAEPSADCHWQQSGRRHGDSRRPSGLLLLHAVLSSRRARPPCPLRGLARIPGGAFRRGRRLIPYGSSAHRPAGHRPAPSWSPPFPAGATVDVNGHRMTQTTPAQIPLAAGAYRVTVEKDGKQATSPVDIRNGAISYLRITLQ